MNPKQRARLWLLLLLVVCGGAVGGRIWYRSRPLSPSAMLARMPPDAIVVYVDFNALRRGGLMDRIFNTKTPQDPDYRSFVRNTGFDFREHLASAMVAFATTGNYMLLNGQFDWKKLKTYVQKEGGTCYVMTCGMAGSVPERRISFLPVRTNVMALAIGTQERAVQRLLNREPDPEAELPGAPVWLSVPGAALKSGALLPGGTRMFARIIEHADRVVLALGTESGKLVANMDVLCQTEWEAKAISDQLTAATFTLREMLAREKLEASARDLSGVLTAGIFRTDGLHAKGQWQIPDQFVENVLNGGVN